MRDHHVEVFPQTSEHSLLRLDGDSEDRYLDKDAITALVQRVEDVYVKGGNAPITFGSAELLQLGRELYQFLDGDGRWLSKVVSDPPGAVLRIDAEERLRHLPWELMVETDSYLTLSPTIPFIPVRSVGTNAALREPDQANRPLRVLFMATSPEGVEPVLAYEQEEALILESTANTGAELVVEESGTLEGLKFQADSYGAGYFDVLHLSGHADVKDSQPVFLMEDELGKLTYATPDEIARAIGGRWPRLTFVSGCLTANSPDQGDLPSMSESLIKAGAPAVLGWALPVGDLAASQFAAFLYEKLAAGRALHEAVVLARQELYAEKSPFWHFLRLYADRSPFASMVTPLNEPGRARLEIRPAGDVFLDPRTRVSRVAARSEFVGRRRLIQRCLRTLKAPLTSSDAHEGIVLHGMGGLGKSTLASRLLERMPTHQRVVYFGKVDDVAFGQQLKKIEYETIDASQEAISIIDASAPWETRLRYLLNGPLATTPCVFVFDDFEDGNLDERPDGTWAGNAKIAEILNALLTAIRETNSTSRVIITSRYSFPNPAGTRLHFVALETLNRNELTKKLRALEHLSPVSQTDPKIRIRAIEVAANNPRLLEWLNTVVGDPKLDAGGLIGAIEGRAAEFREDILAEKLIESQDPKVGGLLARVNVVELPIPAEAVKAIYPEPDIEAHMNRAADLGLLEAGIDPDNGERQYFVSNVLRPLLRPKLTDEQHQQACAAAARSLHELWIEATNDAETETDVVG